MSENAPNEPRGGLLDLVERIGNKLPDPTTLFFLGAILVMVVSALAVERSWEVPERLPQQNADGSTDLEWIETGKVYKPTSLLTADGLFWAISSMVDNFMSFAPLGVVLVGMLGIGIAERTGLIGALLKAFLLVVPSVLLTPAMVFVGIMSSLALDAGYVVLPPLAAALYKAVGRSPLAGLAAVFAGVAAGFNANLVVTSLDPMLAAMSATGARTIEAGYAVAPTCNLSFMQVSTVLMTLVGWGVTAFFVERRLNGKSPDEGGPLPADSQELAEQRLKPEEKRGLVVALIVASIALVIMLFMHFWSHGALHGMGERFKRWIEAIVPLLFFFFILPGIGYGITVKKLRSDKDLAKMLIESMAAMAPIIVLAFFAAQFIEYFRYSGLDKMLALAGGQVLAQAALPKPLLLVAFILVTLVFNLFVGSMSAKYLMFAPIFVPMFMMVGISPELTQAAYRVGDSASNIITPLNPYLIVVLVFMQKYVPKGGMGTLISTMLPYTVVFTVVWTILLIVWMLLGIPLGPEGPLEYLPKM